MGISDAKRALSGEKPARGSGGRSRKDTSIFGGKSHIEGRGFRRWLSDPKRYKDTGLTGQEIREFGEIIGAKKDWFSRADAEKIERQAKLGKWGGFKGLPKEKRDKLEKLARKILGK